MNEELERILVEALDLLEQGHGVEAILARFPAHAAELRPFLLTATQLARLSTQPSLTAEQRSKRAFLAAAATPAARRAPAGNRLARLLAPALGVLLVVLLGGAALVGASAGAVPGTALYTTKRLVESLRLGLAADPERAATLRERFRLERLAEVEQLLAGGRAADVVFAGTLESIDGPRWTVDGLPVDVAEAVFDGAARVGALVEIAGRVADGIVRAGRVTVLTGGLPDTTPTPPPTPPATDEAEDAGTTERAPVTATTTPPAAPLPATPANTLPAATPESSLPSATPGDPVPTNTPPPPPDNDNDNDNPPTATPEPPPPSPTPGDPAPTNTPPATPDDDNGNDNDDNENDNDDNDNDNGGDNGNDNGDNDNANDNGDNDNGD